MPLRSLSDYSDCRLIVLLEPDSEESVVNAVDALFVCNKVLLEQSFEGGLYRARRRETVFFDKSPGGNRAGFAFFIDGDEQLFLPFRQAEQDFLKGVILRVENILQGFGNHLYRTLSLFGCYTIKRVEHFLHIPRNAVESLVDTFYRPRFDLAAAFFEMGPGKGCVFGKVDAFQIHHRYALVEWARCAGEHAPHNMALAAGKDETGIAAMLDMGTQQCFHVLFGMELWEVKC